MHVYFLCSMRSPSAALASLPSATKGSSDWSEGGRRGLELFGVLDFEKFPPAHSHGSLPSTTTSAHTRHLPRRATHHANPVHLPNPVARPSPLLAASFLPTIISASASSSRLSALASITSDARATAIDRRPPCLPGRAATAMTPMFPWQRPPGQVIATKWYVQPAPGARRRWGTRPPCKANIS